jgi:hypothetical protein
MIVANICKIIWDDLRIEFISYYVHTLGFSECTKEEKEEEKKKAIQGIIIEIWAMMRLFYFVHAFFIHGKRITVNVN